MAGFPWGGAAAGFNQFSRDQMQRDQQAMYGRYLQSLIHGQQMQQDMQKRSMDAQNAMPAVIAKLFAGGGAGVPQPPGAPAGGPQAPSPGTSSQPMQPAGAVPTPPASAAPQQIQPFKAMPTEGPPAIPAMSGSVPPPPAAPAAPDTGVRPAASLTEILGRFDKAMDDANVPPELRGQVFQQAALLLTKASDQELKMLKDRVAQQDAMMRLVLQARGIKAREESNQRLARAEERRAAQDEERLRQGRERLDIARNRARTAAQNALGGAGKIRTSEFIYPRGADGRPDESQPPIGTRNQMKDGSVRLLDLDGKSMASDTPAGGTAKEAKDTRPAAGQAVRQNIVKAGVTNSLARLAEIEKRFPNENTSAFFGTHGEGPISRGVYGAGRSAMSSTQKQADAAWASFIDEAIPVFTGGLRGSDAFRRFLIEQAPGPGDDAKSRAEKIRLMRANIQGTSKTFFQKFQGDPSMWGPGVTQEEIGGAEGGQPASGWTDEKERRYQELLKKQNAPK